MRLALHLAFLAAALLLLLVLPLGEASVLLVLFVAADLGAAALMLCGDAPRSLPVAAIAGDVARLALLRRTVPELRMRRPAVTIEAQVHWRQRTERRRRSREVF